MIRRVQRLIDADRWTDEGLLARSLSKAARLTGMGLWGVVDDQGRMEVRLELIAGAIYPGDPSMTLEQIETHLLELDESGFLRLYDDAGRSWLQLERPLQTPRGKESSAPPAPPRTLPESSGIFLAVGGARARAEERVRAENEQRAAEWAEERAEQERPRSPVRPLLMEAPPIGCPDHPQGRFTDCGPCGTARRRHDRWVQERRYTTLIAEQEAADDDD